MRIEREERLLKEASNTQPVENKRGFKKSVKKEEYDWSDPKF